jgi:hypothetical protein
MSRVLSHPDNTVEASTPTTLKAQTFRNINKHFLSTPKALTMLYFSQPPFLNSVNCLNFKQNDVSEARSTSVRRHTGFRNAVFVKNSEDEHSPKVSTVAVNLSFLRDLY